MIEQIIAFRSQRNLRAFPHLEGLLQHQIELRERGAAQDIAPSALPNWPGGGNAKALAGTSRTEYRRCCRLDKHRVRIAN